MESGGGRVRANRAPERAPQRQGVQHLSWQMKSGEGRVGANGESPERAPPRQGVMRQS